MSIWSRAAANYQLSVSQSWVTDFYTRFIVRPIAAFFVVLLEFTRITPNQITLLSGALHLLMLFVLCFHHYTLAGIGLFLVYLLDCIDGQLARQKNLITEFGRHLDLAVDFFKETTFFLALIFVFRHQSIWFILQLLATLVILNSFLIDWMRKSKQQVYSKPVSGYNTFREKYGLQFWNIGARQLVYTVALLIVQPGIISIYVLSVGLTLTSQKFFRFFRHL
jgi:phosphatidylglycerophosphate synthase